MLTIALFAAVLSAASAASAYSSEAQLQTCTTEEECTNQNSTWSCCLNIERAGNTTYGRCRDTRYETCAAFTICNSKYETTCNTTCCAAGQSCVTAETLEGDQDRCTSTEVLDMRRGMVIIGYPIIFGIATILGVVLSVLFVVIGKTELTLTAILIIAVSLVIAFFSLLLHISPLIFPSFFVASTASFAILSLASGSNRPEVVSAVTLVLVSSAFILMVNPFTGNSLLGGGPTYARTGALLNSAGGVLGAIMSYLAEYDYIFSNGLGGVSATSAVNNDRDIFSSCSAFYLGYFRPDPLLYFDPRIHDQRLRNLPTGLCSRGFLTFELFNGIIVTVLLPILSILLVARLWEVRGKGTKVGDEEMRTVTSA